MLFFLVNKNRQKKNGSARWENKNPQSKSFRYDYNLILPSVIQAFLKGFRRKIQFQTDDKDSPFYLIILKGNKEGRKGSMANKGRMERSEKEGTK